MKHLAIAIFISSLLSIGGCASLLTPPLHPGATEAQVINQLGTPTGIYPDGNDKLLEYARGRFGQATFMARIGPDHRLVSYEQVLTLEKFSSIKINQSHQDDVLRIVGKPIDSIYYDRIKLHGWNYGYKENGVWNSLMTIYFDQSGIVRKLENGPDPRFEHARFGAWH